MEKSTALVFLYLLAIELLLSLTVSSIRSPVPAFLHKNEDKWVIEFDVTDESSSSPPPPEMSSKSVVDDLGKREVPGGPDPQHHSHEPSANLHCNTAESQGLPLLQPYLAPNQNFRRGANFAVAGATAMDPAALIELGINRYIWTNFSLTTQLQWFDKLKPSLCKTTQECNEYFKKSLFLVGEIGGNDYNYAFFSGKTAAEVTSLVPRVVSAIAEAIEGLIERGAVNLVVPGNLPVGCSTAYLTLFSTAEKEEYDGRNGCLKKLNAFARYHNEFLKMAMGELRRKHPNARIVYADYYGAAMRFAHAPRHFGFGKGALQTCCGGGGPYNFNVTARCGHPGSHACNDPSNYVSWDGIHLTEAAYRHIATGLLEGSFTDLPLMT